MSCHCQEIHMSLHSIGYNFCGPQIDVFVVVTRKKKQHYSISVYKNNNGFVHRRCDILLGPHIYLTHSKEIECNDIRKKAE